MPTPRRSLSWLSVIVALLPALLAAAPAPAAPEEEALPEPPPVTEAAEEQAPLEQSGPVAQQPAPVEQRTPEGWLPFEQDTRKLLLRGAAVAGGATLGLGVGLAMLFGGPLTGDVPMFKPGSNALLVTIVSAPTIAVMAASLALAMWGFTEGVIFLAPNLWVAAPLGLVMGMAVGAFSGGAAFSMLMAMGYPLGVIDTGRLNNFFIVSGMGFVAGAFWGAFSGIVPGLILGPAFRLWIGPEEDGEE